MQAIFLQNTLAEWEHQARTRASRAPLMDQAGAALAALALQMAKQSAAPILVVAGGGNNGGDGLEAAAVLLAQGMACRVYAVEPGKAYRGDALRALEHLRAAGGLLEPLPAELGQAALIIDAIYGTGLNRAPSGAGEHAIELINRAKQEGTPVLAVDLPSGLVSDSGHAPGAVVKASATISFLGAKPALYTGAGTDCCGTVSIVPLEPHIDLSTPGFLNGPAAFGALLNARHNNSNKGSFGTLAVIGGAQGTVGAALLASRAALHTGAGKVFVETLGDDSLKVDLLHPELMIRTRVDLEHVDAVVIGPGLGDSSQALEVLRHVVASALPALFDADALNLMSKHADLAAAFADRSAPSILTPHPLEAARLLDVDVNEIAANRINAALKIATRYNAVVILKGAGSIIAAANGRWAINPTGNPGLATGGTGDVLSGAIGGLLGQQQDAFQTALAGCYLHGDAADICVKAGLGPIGLTASELIPAIRQSLNRHVRPN
jgi:hydroxyethylthiazole kinase-like uncharacterized protein yjeF